MVITCDSDSFITYDIICHYLTIIELHLGLDLAVLNAYWLYIVILQGLGLLFVIHGIKFAFKQAQSINILVY